MVSPAGSRANAGMAALTERATNRAAAVVDVLTITGRLLRRGPDKNAAQG